MNALIQPEDPKSLSRRQALTGAGCLIFAFSLSPSKGSAQQAPPQQPQGGQTPVQPPPGAPLPGSLKTSPDLESWIRVDADGKITVFTGKAELGQGLKTALIQVAAEQLAVPFNAVHLITADTELTPNEGYTAGSHSMQDSGTAILNAAAQVREIIIGMAAQKLNLPPEQLTAKNAIVVASNGKQMTYGEIVAGARFNAKAQATSKLIEPKHFKIMGKDIRRVDIPAKLTGGAAFVQDLRLPNMVHARVVRPPSYGASLTTIDTSGAEKMPGVLKIVHDGSFLAVVATKEFQAITAMRALAVAARWKELHNL
ncbi:MAG TPA: molybdopterin cofactor-binding domain-containing protein, partial [Beijerinckiaceae bacterium]|nr:molybdopterin cofactor-binding domain-containing protein [Beijerinckiaceae bacterium]